MAGWIANFLRPLRRVFKEQTPMQIPALDLIGEYHMKLAALENYFTQLADVGAKQPSGQYADERSATSRSLQNLRRFRLELDALRIKNHDAIAQTMAGHRPNIKLNEMETTLLESIAEMYEQVWSNRRERLQAS